MGNKIMVREIVAHPVVDRSLIRLDIGSNLYVLFHDGLDVFQRHPFNLKRADTAPVLAALHQRDYGALLALRTICPDKARAFLFRAYPRLINFDYALEFFYKGVLRHREAQPM